MACILVATAQPVRAHGSHSRLMERVDAALAEKPEDGGLWYCRARLAFEHRDLAGSLLDLEKTEKFSPGKYPTLWLKGRVLEAANRLEEARAALDAFLAGDPGNSGALASRARVATKLGLAEMALADYRDAMARAPDAGPDLVHEVARALASGGHVDESIQVLERALSRLGPVPSLQLEIVGIEASAQRYDSALSRLDGFQRGSPRPEPWVAKRASLLAQAGRLTESRAAWQSLLDHVGQLPPAERDSHAMTTFSEQARQAISSLGSSSRPTFSPP